MDHLNLRDRELEIDVESGGTTSEEEKTKDPVSAKKQKKKFLSWVWGGVLNFSGSVSGHCDLASFKNSSKFGVTVEENVDLLIDKSSGDEEIREHKAFLEKRYAKENHKKKNSKRPPKPPLPPNGPSLDAADQKLIREITELSMRKRARVERIKALKKLKAAKASSSSNSSSLAALVITLIFCLVIIFQGVHSWSSSRVRFQGSPEPAVVNDEGWISVQFYKNLAAHGSDRASSSALDPAEEQLHGSGPEGGGGIAEYKKENFER